MLVSSTAAAIPVTAARGPHPQATNAGVLNTASNTGSTGGGTGPTANAAVLNQSAPRQQRGARRPTFAFAALNSGGSTGDSSGGTGATPSTSAGV